MDPVGWFMQTVAPAQPVSVFPEAVGLIGAGLTPFVVGMFKAFLPDHLGARFNIVLTAASGFLVTFLVYQAGFVDLTGLGNEEIIPRIILGGLNVALAASGVRSWQQASQNNGNGPNPPNGGRDAH